MTTLSDNCIRRLLAVKQRILEEPARLCMTDWYQYKDERRLNPACNTVGCIAGWLVANNIIENCPLTAAGNPTDGEDILADFSGDFEDDAADLLELSVNQCKLLFFPLNWPKQFIETRCQIEEQAWDLANPDDFHYARLYRSSSWPLKGNPLPQSPEYAQIVANRIDHFIATDGRE